MKYLAAIILFVSFSAFTFIESFYSLSIKNIEGETIDLASFKGKKVLFIVLPASAQDNTVTVEELTALQKKYKDLLIIGVLSEETGYKSSEKGKVKAIYKNQPSNFILAEGMKVNKAAGQAQSSVFTWLTHVERNGFYNTDVLGVGHKFFINGEGRLYGVISGNTRLSSPVIDKILSR
jgi:glutathione peroxidase